MVYLIVIGFVVFLTLGYFFLMFFFPEWVGISGEDTKKAIESHRGETSPKDSRDMNSSEADLSSQEDQHL